MQEAAHPSSSAMLFERNDALVVEAFRRVSLIILKE